MMNTKRLYTIASINGFTNADVKGYIAFEFGINSTKDLTEEQYNQLIKYLDKELEMAEQKTYVGNGKEKTFDNGGSLINFGLKLSDLQAHVNEKGYVNLVIGKKKEVDKYDNTHAIWVNDFKPNKQEEKKEESAF